MKKTKKTITKIKKKSKPMGRPAKDGLINLPVVKQLYMEGKTDKQVAEALGVCESTFTRWKQKNKDFCTSIKDWKVEADKKVEVSLYERACGYSHPEEKIFCSDGEIIRAETTKHYPPDATSTIFWLKNRKPKEWRDKTDVDLHVDRFKDLDVTNLTVEKAIDEINNRLSAQFKRKS